MFNFKKYFSGFFGREEEIKIDIFPENLDEKPLRDVFESIKLYGKNHDTIEKCIVGLVDKYYNHSNSRFPEGENINFTLRDNLQDYNWNFKTEYYQDNENVLELDVSESKDGKIYLNACLSPFGIDHSFPRLQYSGGTLLMLMGQSGYNLLPFRNCRSEDEKVLVGRSSSILTSEIMKRELNNSTGKYIHILPDTNENTFANKRDINLYGRIFENFNGGDYETTKIRN
ncbi:MAG: hypothetical protein ABEK17_02485 [Candidatus Aenigmatarchaeota archaeon]